MKRKIATLIMLIILLIISITGITIISINTFGKDEPAVVEPIEYPMWLDESFYESKDVNRETALHDRVEDYYNEYGSTPEDLDGADPKEVSFVMNWFALDFFGDGVETIESEYLNVDSYIEDNIYNDWIEFKEDINETILIGFDKTIDLGNVANINNSIVGSRELLIGEGDSLTINNSIIYSVKGSLFDEISKYDNVEINNSIIISNDHAKDSVSSNWGNIHITNSVISGTSKGDGAHVDFNEYHLLDAYWEMNINNVYYDDFFERLIH